MMQSTTTSTRWRRALVARTCVRLVRLASRALPHGFRDRFADSIVALYVERLTDHPSSFAVVRETVRELGGLVREIIVQHARGARADGGFVRKPELEIFRGIAHAVRVLVLTPLYAIAVVLTLGAGTGGVTALLAVARVSLLAPLPYAAPDRIVRIGENAHGPYDGTTTSLPNVLAWRERVHSLTSIVAVSAGEHVNVRVAEETRRVEAARISSDGFSLLGVRPYLGRALEATDFAPGAAPRIVISYGLWRALGSDTSLVGRTIRMNAHDVQVAGVMPAGFAFPSAATDVLLPMVITPGVGLATANGRWARLFQAYGRLRPGVTMEQANGELRSVSRALESEFGDPNRGMFASVRPLRDAMLGNSRTLIAILLTASLLVLLIACSNVAALAMVRMSGQERAIAVRLALGASRARIIALVASEALVLAAFAAALSMIVSRLALPQILSLVPAGLPHAQIGNVELALWSVALSITASLLLLAATMPAGGRRARIATTLVSSGVRAGWTRAHRRVRMAAVITQIAMAAALLIGGAAVLRSYRAVMHVDPGFDPSNAVAVSIGPRGQRYSNRAAVVQFYDGVLQRVRALPGVLAAGVTDALPLSDGGTSWTFVPDGRAIAAGQEPSAVTFTVDEQYPAALGMRILAGRPLAASDTFPNAENIVVSEMLAKSTFGGVTAALGHRVALGSATSGNPPMTIVGVVADVHDGSLTEEPMPSIYRRYSGSTMPTSMTLVIQSRGEPGGIFNKVRAIVNDLDHDAPLFDARPLPDIIHEAARPQRLVALLTSCFAGLALLLAALGTIGLLTQLVLDERRANAIRLALGATRSHVVARMTRVGAVIAAAGIAGGCFIAATASGVLRQFLFNATAMDPVAIAGVACLLFVIACAAALLPALSSTRTAIASTLHSE